MTSLAGYTIVITQTAVLIFLARVYTSQLKNFFFEGGRILPGPYDPREALQIRASCHKQRNHYNSSEYTKGKICFGAYSRELVDKTLRTFGQLFHNISPDYSSMVLASVIAESAYELEDAGVVHINSKISNGG